MPIRIYRYVLAEVLYPFFGGFVFFMFVFLMFQVVRLADYFINHGVGLFLLAKLTIYISAAFLPVVLPISFLVAILVGFGRMSADSEIVALKASGMSLYQLYIPVAVFSVLVAGAIFYLANYFIPWGNLQFKSTVIKIGNTKVVSNLKEGTFTEGFFDLLVYADKVDVEHNRMEGVFIYDERDPKNPLVILSQDGVVVPLKSSSELATAAILKLNDGSIHRSDLVRKNYEKINFNEYRILLKVEEGHVGEITVPKTLTSPDLKKRMVQYGAEFDRYKEYAIEYGKRIALGMAPLLFGILGVGLGVVRSRSVKSNAVFVAFGVVILYWGLHVVGTNLAEKAILPPFLAMQISNLAVVPFAVLSFRKSTW